MDISLYKKQKAWGVVLTELIKLYGVSMIAEWSHAPSEHVVRKWSSTHDDNVDYGIPAANAELLAQELSTPDRKDLTISQRFCHYAFHITYRGEGKANGTLEDEALKRSKNLARMEQALEAGDYDAFRESWLDDQKVTKDLEAEGERIR